MLFWPEISALGVFFNFDNERMHLPKYPSAPPPPPPGIHALHHDCRSEQSTKFAKINNTLLVCSNSLRHPQISTCARERPIWTFCYEARLLPSHISHLDVTVSRYPLYERRTHQTNKTLLMYRKNGKSHGRILS